MAPSKSLLIAALFCASLALVSAMAITNDSEDSQEMPVDPKVDYRRAVMILRRALSNVDASDETKSIKKRTCYFNAGLSHGCDYKELLRALDESTYWNSDLTPGRRRKRSLSRRHPDMGLPVHL